MRPRAPARQARTSNPPLPALDRPVRRLRARSSGKNRLQSWRRSVHLLNRGRHECDQAWAARLVLTGRVRCRRLSPMRRSPVSSEWREQARILKALAHPGRLQILQTLAEGERCVCDLAAMLGVRVPTASRYLALLREAGIGEDEKRGVQVFYRLRTRCDVNFFRCVEAVEESRETTPRRRTGRRSYGSDSLGKEE